MRLGIQVREESGPENLRSIYSRITSLNSCLPELVEELWRGGPDVRKVLAESPTLAEARRRTFSLLADRERWLLSLRCRLHPLEKANARAAIGTFKNLLGPASEKKAGCSALKALWKLAADAGAEFSSGFLMEMIHLIKGVSGASGIYGDGGVRADYVPRFLGDGGRQAAVERTDALDREAARMHAAMARYRSGLEDEIVQLRQANRKRILDYLGGDESDWSDYRWQISNIVRDPTTLTNLIDVPKELQRSVALACENGVPFGITPYYLSLMDPACGGGGLDHAVRAQVIPPGDYVQGMLDHKDERFEFFDFMGERNTSPVDLVTRRYPEIAIFKPFSTCAQICVYCQRNWEIEQVMAPHALASPKSVDSALQWFEDHRQIEEVLVTGGDPCVMSDRMLAGILSRFARIDHIRRIRIGTRTPVVLPMRWTRELVGMLDSLHVPARRELAVVTHFEHPYEITPEAALAVERIRRSGIGVYNQQVFTLANSRRFETAKLRVDLRRIGVDPYYNFNMKGKEETSSLRVPIARILQERKEEARLLPGLDRTDESVFNVPNLGKNHLRAWQDHRVIMVRPDGRRVYEFQPWEKNLAAVPCYDYVDVSVLEYLQRLAFRGEDPWDYRSIWYYY